MDLTTEYDPTLYFKNSFLINPDINNYHKVADFRMDNYEISHILDTDILYYNFFRLITPNIYTYILRTSPNNENPIKYTFVVHNIKVGEMRILKILKIFKLI